MTDLSFMTLQNLEAWLSTKPENKTYDYTGKDHPCPLTEFAASHGFNWRAGYQHYFTDEGSIPLPEHFNDIVRGRTVKPSWTYRLALRRCREAIKAEAEKLKPVTEKIEGDALQVPELA